MTIALPPELRGRMRTRQAVLLLGLCFFAAISTILLRDSSRSYAPPIPGSGAQSNSADKASQLTSDASSHPIQQLAEKAQKEHAALVKRQSKTLDEAVIEYRRRYRIPPPPNFDKWFEFAKAKGVTLIDEYDSVYHSLLPFWALSPRTVRERTYEALGMDNYLVGLLIRDGKVKNMVKRDEWLADSLQGMMADFVQYLPDMDLAFNTHDEPRVVVVHDDLVRLVKNATDHALPAAFANPSPRNAWSARPSGMSDATRLPEVRITRFNRFAHQPTWSISRLSCPPDSPSRAMDESTPDDTASFSFSALNLVQNDTAFSDICNSPSLGSSFGFFDRPNAFDIVHDLFPIFSQSKMSSFQDILYPSPWYWSNKVPYEDSEDKAWEEKKNQLYWRGSTTGGFSRNGGWRRQHRQHMVQEMNALDRTKIYENDTSTSLPLAAAGAAAAGTKSAVTWRLKEDDKPKYKDLFDVHFSHVGQCDPGDCDAQKEFFGLHEGKPQNFAWNYKYLLDMDGNAFSGRFYAFLKSKSLVFKMALFREWHADWLKPWVHYVPLSLKGDEYFEALRYFDREADGNVLGKALAEGGREWAGKVLRNEDLEVWFFRLLLEYGRVVDDDREHVGFAI